MVFEMVHRGLLTPEEARNHQDRNVLSRALGSHPQVDISCWEEPFPIQPGDRFLLCSDGLHDLVFPMSRFCNSAGPRATSPKPPTDWCSPPTKTAATTISR